MTISAVSQPEVVTAWKLDIVTTGAKSSLGIGKSAPTLSVRIIMRIPSGGFVQAIRTVEMAVGSTSIPGDG
jgi:hypothetical protein